MTDNRHWLQDAACGPNNIAEEDKDVDWYSSDRDEKYHARAICQSRCPVRKECIEDALNHKDIWGIHGGVDDYEIRRTLSVDAFGEPKQRTRAPRCPYCMSGTLKISGQKTRAGYATECLGCGLKWSMALIPTKLRGKKST